MLVPGRGLEPPWDCSRQLLRLVRLPFRHPGLLYLEILTNSLLKSSSNSCFTEPGRLKYPHAFCVRKYIIMIMPWIFGVLALVIGFCATAYASQFTSDRLPSLGQRWVYSLLAIASCVVAAWVPAHQLFAGNVAVGWMIYFVFLAIAIVFAVFGLVLNTVGFVEDGSPLDHYATLAWLAVVASWLVASIVNIWLPFQ